MFLINNEILSKQNLPDHWAWYSKKINSIKKEKKYYVFSAFKLHRYEVGENGKKIRMKRFKSIPTSSTFENVEMSETQTWVYVPSANSIRNENGLIKVLNPKPFMISEASIYNSENDADIIFYLLYISEALKHKNIFLIDYELENIKKANKSAIEAEAQYLIFNDKSPINEELLGTDEIYRQLAINYGVQGSSNLLISELKNKLWNNLQSLPRTKKNPIESYKQFISDCYNSTNSEMRSTILLAIERGIIYFEKSAWYIKIRGQYDELVVRIASNEEINKKDILINYLIQHKEYISIVKEAIDNTTTRLIDKMEINEEEEDPDKMTRPQLVKKLISLGINNKEAFSMATDELRKKIKNSEQKEISQ